MRLIFSKEINLMSEFCYVISENNDDDTDDEDDDNDNDDDELYEKASVVLLVHP